MLDLSSMVREVRPCVVVQVHVRCQLARLKLGIAQGLASEVNPVNITSSVSTAIHFGMKMEQVYKMNTVIVMRINRGMMRLFRSCGKSRVGFPDSI